MANWLETLRLRKAGEVAGFQGDNETNAAFTERSRVKTPPPAPGALSAPSNPAPGWWADPYGVHELRYYDGAVWTEHVADAGTQGVDPPSVSAGAHTVALPQP